MNLKPVNSSRMKMVGWNDNTMYIQFNNDDIYAYSDVSYNEYKEFISAPSLGKYLVTFQTQHSYYKI